MQLAVQQVGRAGQAQAVALGRQAVSVHRVRETVCPLRSPDQALESAPEEAVSPFQVLTTDSGLTNKTYIPIVTNGT